MRYFIKLAYRGTPFAGWQTQPNALSVQQCMEETLGRLLKTSVSLVGCGRTDTGVHASEYFAHFDWEQSDLPQDLISRLNRMLPPEIAIYDLYPVSTDLHARFSATRRTYHYHLTGERDPFRQDLVYAFYNFDKLDRPVMQEAAHLIGEFDAFYPFCKSHSGVEHYRCQIYHSGWKESGVDFIYEISANRFLRGMVRLIVGMCIQAGLHQISLAEVRSSLVSQTPLPKSLSVPARGLFLTKIMYD